MLHGARDQLKQKMAHWYCVLPFFFNFAWRVGRGGCGIEQHGLLWEGDGYFSF